MDVEEVLPLDEELSLEVLDEDSSPEDDELDASPEEELISPLELLLDDGSLELDDSPEVDEEDDSSPDELAEMEDEDSSPDDVELDEEDSSPDELLELDDTRASVPKRMPQSIRDKPEKEGGLKRHSTMRQFIAGENGMQVEREFKGALFAGGHDRGGNFGTPAPTICWLTRAAQTVVTRGKQTRSIRALASPLPLLPANPVTLARPRGFAGTVDSPANEPKYDNCNKRFHIRSSPIVIV